MTSTSIYTPITPTYLYIKQHFITGLKYFGKTTKDPYKYNGSGKRWTRHIKKHGKEHIVTLWVSEPYTDTSITEFALKFSIDNDIVNSKEWANLIPENGLDGDIAGNLSCNYGRKHTKKFKSFCSTRITKVNIEKSKNRTHQWNKENMTEEHKEKLRLSKLGNTNRKGILHTEETKLKIGAARKGKSDPIIICPHCNKSGGNRNMKRYHFDNCHNNPICK